MPTTKILQQQQQQHGHAARTRTRCAHNYLALAPAASAARPSRREGSGQRGVEVVTIASEARFFADEDECARPPPLPRHAMRCTAAAAGATPPAAALLALPAAAHACLWSLLPSQTLHVSGALWLLGALAAISLLVLLVVATRWSIRRGAATRVVSRGTCCAIAGVGATTGI